MVPNPNLLPQPHTREKLSFLKFRTGATGARDKMTGAIVPRVPQSRQSTMWQTCERTFLDEVLRHVHMFGVQGSSVGLPVRTNSGLAAQKPH